MIPNNFTNLSSQYFVSIYGEPDTRLDVLRLYILLNSLNNPIIY